MDIFKVPSSSLETDILTFSHYVLVLHLADDGFALV